VLIIFHLYIPEWFQPENCLTFEISKLVSRLFSAFLKHFDLMAILAMEKNLEEVKLSGDSGVLANTSNWESLI